MQPFNQVHHHVPDIETCSILHVLACECICTTPYDPTSHRSRREGVSSTRCLETRL